MARFIEINLDIFQIDRIQAVGFEDLKNELGTSSGVYTLKIDMVDGYGSTHKAYLSKEQRDNDFQIVKRTLLSIK